MTGHRNRDRIEPRISDTTIGKLCQNQSEALGNVDAHGIGRDRSHQHCLIAEWLNIESEFTQFLD